MNELSEWELLARYLAGECSEEEQATVAASIAADPERQRLVTLMSTASEPPRSAPSDVDGLWGEVAHKTGIASSSGRTIEWSRPWLPPLRRYAVAALLVVCSLASFQAREMGLLPWNRQAIEWVTLAVENGGRDDLTLSDGTRIRLDAGSSLKYPAEFGDEERVVFLSGEGFFEVAHNKEKPFVVHANHAIVEVLGTEFNIRAWQPEQRVTVAVAEGRVSLGTEGTTTQAVELNKGQMSSLPPNGPPPRRAPLISPSTWDGCSTKHFLKTHHCTKSSINWSAGTTFNSHSRMSRWRQSN
jgi:transmembrane sensor